MFSPGAFGFAAWLMAILGVPTLGRTFFPGGRKCPLRAKGALRGFRFWKWRAPTEQWNSLFGGCAEATRSEHFRGETARICSLRQAGKDAVVRIVPNKKEGSSKTETDPHARCLQARSDKVLFYVYDLAVQQRVQPMKKYFLLLFSSFGGCI